MRRLVITAATVVDPLRADSLKSQRRRDGFYDRIKLREFAIDRDVFTKMKAGRFVTAADGTDYILKNARQYGMDPGIAFDRWYQAAPPATSGGRSPVVAPTAQNWSGGTYVSPDDPDEDAPQGSGAEILDELRRLNSNLETSVPSQSEIETLSRQIGRLGDLVEQLLNLAASAKKHGP